MQNKEKIELLDKLNKISENANKDNQAVKMKLIEEFLKVYNKNSTNEEYFIKIKMSTIYLSIITILISILIILFIILSISFDKCYVKKEDNLTKGESSTIFYTCSRQCSKNIKILKQELKDINGAEENDIKK